MMDYISLSSRYELDVYSKREVVLVRGKNARVWDDQGNEYIDCTSGHGVASIGHCNDYIVRAVKDQVKKLITCSGSFHNNVRSLLMEKLVSLTSPGLKRVFLCNSGSESVEAALKFARFSTGRSQFVAAMRGFHGRTLGSLSATHRPLFRKGFEPLIPGFRFVPFNEFEAIEKAVTSDTAGILLEVVQGEGGVHIGESGYFHKIRKLCDEKNILLILDEVQTGFYRTGKSFAYEHMEIEPDILCLAKAMAGGLPMGAVICADHVQIPIGKHGSTFGGNPLACAAALAAMDFMSKEKLDEVSRNKGEYLMKRLSSRHLPDVREIRQIGLMLGIEIKQRVQPFIQKLLENHVLVLPAGKTVLRLLPPLTIPYEDINLISDKLLEVLGENNIK